jgi:hypothetical protein
VASYRNIFENKRTQKKTSFRRFKSNGFLQCTTDIDNCRGIFYEVLFVLLGGQNKKCGCSDKISFTRIRFSEKLGRQNPDLFLILKSLINSHYENGNN